MKFIQLLIIGMVLQIVTINGVFAQKEGEKSEEVYKPSETSIAVLFAPNFSSDKWEGQKKKESVAARQIIYKLFAERGFQSISSEKVDDEVSKEKIDLLKEDQWTKSNFYKIGKETGADLVAFVLIKQTRQKTVSNLLMSSYQAEAEIEVWLLDVKRETALINDEASRGQANRGARGAGSRRISAVEFAVKKALEPILKSYVKTDTKKKK